MTDIRIHEIRWDKTRKAILPASKEPYIELRERDVFGLWSSDAERHYSR